MAAYKELYDAYFTEINNICEMLGKYVSVYRTLIDGASALNNIAFSKKSDIKKALKRANTMGDIIDELIDAIGEVDFCYLDYLQSKSAYIAHNVPKSSVFSELGSGLFLAGQFNTINNMPDIYKNVFKNGFNGFGKNSNNGGNNGGNNQGNNGQGDNSETPAAEPSNNEADDIKYQGENENNNAGQNSDEIVYKDNNENDTYDNENIEGNDDISQSYDDNSDYDE